MKCDYCNNYDNISDECKYCQFEYNEYYVRDDWDILELDIEYEWTHIQIMNRLKCKNIDCVFADIWDKELAFLIGCNETSYKIANALGVNEDVIYNDSHHSLIIVNLFQERFLRGELKDG